MELLVGYCTAPLRRVIVPDLVAKLVASNICHGQTYPVARITYTVLVETLNHAQSINQSPYA